MITKIHRMKWWMCAALFTFHLSLFISPAAAQQAVSPNGKISIDQQGNGLVISYQAQKAIELTSVGFENASSPSKLVFRRTLKESYNMLAGKRLQCTNEANEYIASLGGDMLLVVRLYNDGVAFRYELTDLSDISIPRELTTWRIPEGMKRWMQNWTDSYEEYFPLTTTYKQAPRLKHYDKNAEGYACRWGYPALLEPIDGVFALISEANIERRQSASCLYNEGELYRVTPAENEVKISGEWHSPWRTLILGTLADVVASTLITDVAEPCQLADTDWIKPGVVSWIYWAYNHGSNDYNIICKYVDRIEGYQTHDLVQFLRRLD